ncbi:MAG TPA: diguanylate cyclase [Thermoanaerobaculia bacterium]|nr:diguanylate cyclase [Thermoanaerobaculia bacterium]
MLQRITDALARAFDWQLVVLVSIDPERHRFVCEALTTSVPTVVHAGFHWDLGSGVVGEVAERLEPIVIDDVRLHPAFIDIMPGVMSEICVPVMHKGQLVSILNIESTRAAAFHDQLPLLLTVADQIAGAIASARLYGELQRRARLMEMMSEVSRTALEATNLREFLDRVVRYVYQHFELEIAAIRLYDAATEEYVRAADAGATSQRPGNRWPLTAGITGRCLRTGRTQLVRDVEADPEYERTSATVTAELVVPIRLRGETLGALNLESPSADVFSAANVIAFEAFADQIAGALKILRTNEELTAAKLQLEQQKRDVQFANTNLAQMIDKLNEVSALDSLTGIHSRRHFDHMLGIEWRRAARARRPLALVIGDIDSFKAYNDRLGHPAGDECLRRVAAAIGETVQRAGEVVARYGGEEFAVLLPDTDAESATRVGETIRARVATLAIPHPSSPTGGELTISVGVAAAMPDGDEHNAPTLIHSADRALYAAKRAGRNRVVTWGRDMEPRGRKYSAPGIDVYFEARLCIHAAQCVSGLPAVFDPTAKPWINPANSSPQPLADAIERCPTGALHYVRRDGGAEEVPPPSDSVSLVTGGPLYIKGDITLENVDGTEVRRDSRMALCRCGQSRNKPFCDNSHLAAKFEQ